MFCETNFYLCKHCKNLVGLIQSSGAVISCCGEPMVLLEANTAEAAVEKHLPVVSVSGDAICIQVGSAAHPMEEAHSIQWIYLQTEHGGQRKCLSPGQAPQAEFALREDTAVAAFAYCNLHGLWKTEI